MSRNLCKFFELQLCAKLNTIPPSFSLNCRIGKNWKLTINNYDSFIGYIIYSSSRNETLRKARWMFDWTRVVVTRGACRIHALVNHTFASISRISFRKDIARAMDHMMGAPLSLRHKMNWIAEEEEKPREKVTRKMRRDLHAARKRPKRDRSCMLPVI